MNAASTTLIPNPSGSESAKYGEVYPENWKHEVNMNDAGPQKYVTELHIYVNKR
jgi:hypothetical protein